MRRMTWWWTLSLVVAVAGLLVAAEIAEAQQWYEAPVGEVPPNPRDPKDPEPAQEDPPVNDPEREVVVAVADIDGDGEDELIIGIFPLSDPLNYLLIDEDGDGDTDIAILW